MSIYLDQKIDKLMPCRISLVPPRMDILGASIGRFYQN